MGKQQHLKTNVGKQQQQVKTKPPLPPSVLLLWVPQIGNFSLSKSSHSGQGPRRLNKLSAQNILNTAQK